MEKSIIGSKRPSKVDLTHSWVVTDEATSGSKRVKKELKPISLYDCLIKIDSCNVAFHEKKDTLFFRFDSDKV